MPCVIFYIKDLKPEDEEEKMIKIENLMIDLPKFSLKDINLNITKNEFFVLMGPTGAGKTVLLEAIAGLIPVKQGKIIIENRDITKLLPENRGIGIVYQDFSLFSHLNVKQNIDYGLHFRKINKKEARNRVNLLIKQLNLNNLLNRNPETLSSGEVQRITLARALAVDPQVLLLDEPLTSLDPNFREEIRNMLKILHRSTDTTFLMVTHDFAEALSLARQGAVINNGKIEQKGPIQDIFNKPSSKFAADFVGMKNIFPAVFKQNKVVINNLEIETANPSAFKQKQGYIAIRPEDIVVSRKPFTSSMRNSFKGVVSRVIDKGFSYEIDIKVKDTTFKSLITKRSLIELKIIEGARVFLSFKATAVHGF